MLEKQNEQTPNEKNKEIFAIQKVIQKEMKSILKEKAVLEMEDFYKLEKLNEMIDPLYNKLNIIELRLTQNEMNDAIKTLKEQDETLKEVHYGIENISRYNIFVDDLDMSMNFDDVMEKLPLENQIQIQEKLESDKFGKLLPNVSGFSSAFLKISYAGLNLAKHFEPSGTGALGAAASVISKGQNLLKSFDKVADSSHFIVKDEKQNLTQR